MINYINDNIIINKCEFYIECEEWDILIKPKKKNNNNKTKPIIEQTKKY